MNDPVPVDNNIADQVAQSPAIVFHGTRVSMAERIVADGFAPLPVGQQIEAVAAAYDIPVKKLQADLREHNRFAVLDPRPDTVFVTGHPVKAGSWADRAPEATWEALWAVYRIRHPELGWYWSNAQEGHLWVLAQRLDDPPAMVFATAALEALRDGDGGGTAADLFADAMHAGGTQKALAAARRTFVGSAEWLVGPCDLTARGYAPVPVRVDNYLLMFMAGQTWETFVEQVNAGHWGEEGESSGDGAMPWWPFGQVWERLSGDRQAELEELVGVPITSLLVTEHDHDVSALAPEA